MQFLSLSYTEDQQISFKNGSATFWKQGMSRISTFGWEDTYN